MIVPLKPIDSQRFYAEVAQFPGARALIAYADSEYQARLKTLANRGMTHRLLGTVVGVQVAKAIESYANRLGMSVEAECEYRSALDVSRRIDVAWEAGKLAIELTLARVDTSHPGFERLQFINPKKAEQITDYMTLADPWRAVAIIADSEFRHHGWFDPAPIRY